MTAKLPIVASALLVVAIAAAAGVAADPGGKMTICHMPHGDPAGARTLQVSRSAWSGHRGHGDHEGACTDADRRAHPPAAASKPTPTRLALSHDEGEGELDGDASFRVLLVNEGPAAARDVRLAGSLGGDGRWSLRHPVPGCSIAEGRLSCELGQVPAESGFNLRLHYDGHAELCSKVGIDLVLTASNDATAGDDRVKDSVRVGACSPLDRPAAAAPPAPALAPSAF